MVAFDAAGRFKAATRLDGVALLGEPAEPSEISAGFRLLIDVGAESRTIDAKLRLIGPTTAWRSAGRGRIEGGLRSGAIRCPGPAGHHAGHTLAELKAAFEKAGWYARIIPSSELGHDRERGQRRPL